MYPACTLRFLRSGGPDFEIQASFAFFVSFVVHHS